MFFSVWIDVWGICYEIDAEYGEILAGFVLIYWDLMLGRRYSFWGRLCLDIWCSTARSVLGSLISLLAWGMSSDCYLSFFLSFFFFVVIIFCILLLCIEWISIRFSRFEFLWLICIYLFWSPFSLRLLFILLEKCGGNRFSLLWFMKFVTLWSLQ